MFHLKMEDSFLKCNFPRWKVLSARLFKFLDEEQVFSIFQFYQFKIFILMSNEIVTVGLTWFISVNERRKHFVSCVTLP